LRSPAVPERFTWVDRKRKIIGLVFTQTPRGRSPLRRFRELVNLSIEGR